VVGGELTLELLDSVYIPSQRYYEGARRTSGHGGVFWSVNFGRERVSPDQLLQPVYHAHGVSGCIFHLRTVKRSSGHAGTCSSSPPNLSPEAVTDPAFLRAHGYRVYLGAPTPEQYTRIFQAYAQRQGASCRARGDRRFAGALTGAQNRELRGVRAARPDRACPRHLPLSRQAAD